MHGLAGNPGDLDGKALTVAAAIQPLGSFEANNAILARLPQRDRHVLAPLLHPFVVAPGQVILPSGPFKDCYFIENGIVSLVLQPADAASVEVGMVGSEGMIGVPAVLGSSAMTHSVVTVTSCRMLAIDAALLNDQAQHHARIRDALLAYANERFEQTLRISACHAQHSVEQRLAEWILSATRLVGSPEIAVTHKQLAQRLGATRPSVTLAVQLLEGRGAIRARRGLVVVRRRELLGTMSCGCYGPPSSDGKRRRRSAGPRSEASRPSRPAADATSVH